MIDSPTELDWQAIRADLDRLQVALESAVVGQRTAIAELLAAVFAGGHILLEGLPGLGKTQLAKALAAGLGIKLARVQCTPDLLPADITGSEILVRAGGQQELEFRPGPLFSPMVLVDEINRATPKTQAAFLEAMQERQVTYGGVQYPLPKPFWVLATQNPIELEGTYPLPEAQLDRFLFKLKIEYPTAAALLAMLEISLDKEPADCLPPVLDHHRVLAIMAQIREVFIAGPIKQAAVELLLATQADHPKASPPAKAHLRYGASPRGLQSLLRAARVLAVRDGRAHVALEDIQAVALPALRHRVLLTIASQLEGINADTVLTGIVQEWRRAH